MLPFLLFSWLNLRLPSMALVSGLLKRLKILEVKVRNTFGLRKPYITVSAFNF